MKNVIAYHLFRLSLNHIPPSGPINEDFQDESLMHATTTPWYGEIANYLVIEELPQRVDWSSSLILCVQHTFFFNEFFLYKYYVDQVIRKWVYDDE